MKRHYRTSSIGAALVSALLGMAGTVVAATNDMAQPGLGATAASNGTGATNAINGRIETTHENCASWGNRLSGSDGQKAWLRVNLSEAAASMTFTRLRLYDRQNYLGRPVPFEISVYNASNTVLETFAYSGANALSYTFTPTGSATGAAYLVYRFTGTVADALDFPEIEALFAGDSLVCPAGFGTNVLNGTIEGGSIGAGLADVRAVRFVQNRQEAIEFNKIEAYDMSVVNVATGGIGSAGGWGTPAGLTNGNGYWISPGAWGGDFPPGNVPSPRFYLGVTMPSSTLRSVRYDQRSLVRTPPTTYGDLQLEAFSDTELTHRIYSRNVSPGYKTGGGWQSFDFLTGGTVWVGLKAGETYRFKISGVTKENDVISVFQMSQSQTGIDFNGAAVRIVLTNGVLRAGDTFKLFDADQFRGSLSTATLNALHEQGWTTTRLLTEGIILREPKGTLIYIQ